MPCDSTGLDPVNSFALVTYIPAPLSKYLDDLRREVAPECVPRAHVTILTPRALDLPGEAAIEVVRSRVADFGPFEIEAGDVEVFADSKVVYLGLRKGTKELIEMYKSLSRPPLKTVEAYSYHPHITLAQELPEGQLSAAEALARRSWAAYDGPRRFAVESVAFVQHSVQKLWLDLAYFQLEGVTVRR